ncbi:MAG: glycosyltransferase family 4 protein [Planctomycetota bacterium]
MHIRALIEAFRETGSEVHEVALVKKGEGPAPGQQPAEQKSGGKWSWVAKTPRFVRELAEYGYSTVAARNLDKAIGEFRPDFIYERYAFGNQAGVRMAAKHKLPIILEVNSPMVHELGKTRGLSFPRLAERIEKRVFLGATRIAVVTEVLKGMLMEMGIPGEKMFVTPNGVHLEHYQKATQQEAREALGIGHVKGLVAGFVGFYRPWHRLDLALEAIADPSLGDCHIALLGEGPAEPELRALAAKLGIEDRVHFVGKHSHHRMPALLPAFDMGLVPNINVYASPLKLHEYMAAGLVSITPDQPNLREVLTPDHDCLMFPPGDGERFQDCLLRLFRDAELRERLGRNARQTVIDRDLTWQGNARRVYQEFERIRSGG